MSCHLILSCEEPFIFFLSCFFSPLSHSLPLCDKGAAKLTNYCQCNKAKNSKFFKEKNFFSFSFFFSIKAARLFLSSFLPGMAEWGGDGGHQAALRFHDSELQEEGGRRGKEATGIF